MKCAGIGCERKAMYKAAQLCQKHYFRLRRTGSTELKEKTRKERFVTPNGYIRVYESGHPLADPRGYVFEHRSVMWSVTGGECEKCELCGISVSWDTCHVDHIDNDRLNNEPSNLRILCRGCNVMLGHTPTSMGAFFLTIDGVTKSAHAWSRHSDCKVTSATIRKRKRDGASDFQAVFGKKKTHKNKAAHKPESKHDDKRGITNG